MNITDSELWELLTDEPNPPDIFLISGSASELKPEIIRQIPWAKRIITQAPVRLTYSRDIPRAYTNYFLRLMWLQEFWILGEKSQYTPSELRLTNYFRGAFLLATGRTINEMMVDFNNRSSIVQSMHTGGLIQQIQDEDNWKLYYYKLTLVGRLQAKKLFEPYHGIYASTNDQDNIRLLKEQKLDNFQSPENAVKKLDEFAPTCMSSVATGKGNRPTSSAETKAEEAEIVWADEPAGTFVANDDQKVIEDAVFRGTLRANFAAKKLTEKEQNILLNETLGIGPTEIARRNGTPESDIKSESDRIRKQIKRSREKN